MDESCFFDAREETCVHFRLAGEGGNKGIDRRAHRSMKPPQAASMTDSSLLSIRNRTHPMDESCFFGAREET